MKEATVKDNIVGQGGKGEDNWTIGFRQHGHQGVTPWVASHALLVIIINIIVLIIIIIIIIAIIVITWMASLIMFCQIFRTTFWVQWGQESNVLDQNVPGCPC